MAAAVAVKHQASAAERTVEGHSKREIMRGLKLYVARETYNSLRRIWPLSQPVGIL
jgi:hypothetical protein